MKRKIFLLLIIQTLFSVETMFAQITFQKTFGGTGYEWGNSVQQTTDGGFIILGETESFGAGDYDVYLIKTDANGDTLWTKTLGGTFADAGSSVQQTIDGGFIIMIMLEGFGAGVFDACLIKTDANGNSLWTKAFGGINNDQGFSVQQSTDGGYIITGQTNSFGAGGIDVYLIKTDANGDSLWTKTFGGTNSDIGRFVQQTMDGGYIITGKTNSFGAGNYDVYLIKTDLNGNSLWTKTFGGIGNEFGWSTQQTSDGGYIISGLTAFGAGASDVYLIKTDSNGDSLWSKTFGGTGNQEGNSVKQTTDGGYVIGGNTDSFGAGGFDVYLIKTDANGDTLWTKTFGGVNDDKGNSVQQATDGGYIIVGFSNSFGAGYNDIILIKTDSLGNSGCNEGVTATIVTTPATQVTSPATIVSSPLTVVTSPATIVGSGGIVTTFCTTVNVPQISNFQLPISIFPNPFSNEINITVTANDLSEIILYDITSRKLLQQTFTGSASLNTPQLSKGIYIYELRNNKNEIIGKGKVVKE